jgi:tetratricopeptide (TPR) repeat protein
MKTQMSRLPAVLIAMAAAWTLAGFCGSTQAGMEVQGRLYLKNDPRPKEGKIRALPGFNKYVVTTMVGNNPVAVEIEGFRVERVEVAKPADLDKTIRQVQTQPAAAIPALKKIMEDYVWLNWDMVAARYLLDAYLKSGQASKAVETANQIIGQNRMAVDNADFLTAYVDAMVADNKESGVENILTEAIKKGGRDIAAVAYVKRGNILKKKGNAKEALVEGYLRVTEMFQEQKDAQPEALYQAAKCFEELGMGTQAERMRTRLRSSQFAGSPWVEKLTGK